jgi:uncharacterized protein (DUF302 family)
MTSRLLSTTTLPEFGSPSFGITKKLDVDFDTAIDKIQDELKKVGFGVITKIDFKETMKKKLDTDLDRNYVILGACNPKLAHQAMQELPSVGLLLPCNIVVTEEDGKAVVSALRPLSLFGLVDTAETGKDMKPLAEEVQGLMNTVIDAL